MRITFEIEQVAQNVSSNTVDCTLDMENVYSEHLPANILVECGTLEGEPERSACTGTCKEQLHSHDCHQNVTGQ